MLKGENMLVNEFTVHVKEYADEMRRVPEYKNIDFGVQDQYGYVWLNFSVHETDKQPTNVCITIPKLIIENGIAYTENKGVRRPVSPYWIEEAQCSLDYYSVMYSILCCDPKPFVGNAVTTTKYTPISDIFFDLSRNSGGVYVTRAQKMIDFMVNRSPMDKTPMNSYMYNRRMIIVDEVFNGITDPSEKLKYTIEKNRKYHTTYGWTSVGLSDSTIVGKNNYIMMEDIRKYTPFGMRHHDFRRNLYSTLGMKGPETAQIMSESEAQIAAKGVFRGGFMLRTAFIDAPGNFQDQILVDNSLKGKMKVKYNTTIQTYGAPQVKAGDTIKTRSIIDINPDTAQVTRCDVIAEHIKVVQVSKTFASVGNIITEVNKIELEFTRVLKNGSKLTNRHGNKGVIRFDDLGYVKHPKTGEELRIQLAVSAASVGRRHNFGQILEAVIGFMNDGNTIVVSDDYGVNPNEAIRQCEDWGYEKDGCLTCHGSSMEGHTCVFGNVFWGCIASVEDSIWYDNDTITENERGLRRKGTKLGPIEFRALRTRFGQSSKVLEEMLSYTEGDAELDDLLDVLRSIEGVVPSLATGRLVPSYSVDQLMPLDTAGGVFFDEAELCNSPVAGAFSPNGYVIKLPITLMTAVDAKNTPVYIGPAKTVTDEEVDRVYYTDRLYVPRASLRKPWKHPIGKYGLTEIAASLNILLKTMHRMLENPTDTRATTDAYRSVIDYLQLVTQMLTGKNGHIATRCMSVRLPLSSKATIGNEPGLPKNTIMIHKRMAAEIGVVDGDAVMLLRYPTLGYMSLRPMWAKITDDPLYRYVIMVSGNSFGSANADHDGDVGYVIAVQTPEAKNELKKDLLDTNSICHKSTERLNELRAGIPELKGSSMRAMKLELLPNLTEDKHTEVVSKLAGVKANTGTVVAFVYSLMRLFEESEYADDYAANIKMETFLDTVANSVFGQKHMGISLHEVVLDAICNLNREALIETNKFETETIDMLFDVLRAVAKKSGIKGDLEEFVEFLNEKKARTNVVNVCISRRHKKYVMSRRHVTPTEVIASMEEPIRDLPGAILELAKECSKHRIDYRTIRSQHIRKHLKRSKFERAVSAYESLLNPQD